MMDFMDSKDQFRALCPHCGQESDWEQQGVIMGGLDPQNKQALLDFSFYRHRCPACGKSFSLLFPFHYIDDRCRHLVRVAGDRKQEEIFPAIEVPGLKAYLLRSPEALREAILAFDAEMDLMVLQAFKWAYYLAVQISGEQQSGARPGEEERAEEVRAELPKAEELDSLYLIRDPKREGEGLLAMEASRGEARFVLPIYMDAYRRFADVFPSDSAERLAGDDYFREVDWRFGARVLEAIKQEAQSANGRPSNAGEENPHPGTDA